MPRTFRRRGEELRRSTGDRAPRLSERPRARCPVAVVTARTHGYDTQPLHLSALEPAPIPRPQSATEARSMAVDFLAFGPHPDDAEIGAGGVLRKMKALGHSVANAYNLAHLRKAPIPGEPHQAKAIYFYFLPPGTPPTFVVDITDQFDDWIAALDCHRSQFHNPDKPRPPQLPSVRENFESFARYWGWQIGTKYAQAFLATSPLRVGDPLSLVRDVVPRP